MDFGGIVTDDDRRRRQTTDASEQNNTDPLRGPVIILMVNFIGDRLLFYDAITFKRIR